MRTLYIIIGLLLFLPAIVFGEKKSVTPFEFRALCTPTNNNPKTFDIQGTHNVDNDWALWGHNLWRVVGKKPSRDVYAIIDGQRDTTQYCFTSPILYKKIEEWIIDQWGESGWRFSILPNDNRKSCQCQRCRAIGNTRTSATPAVASMVTKLATRFPKHQFFMAAYHTTMQPPTKPLPSNAGVQLTTMDIPYRVNFYENKGYRKFSATAEAWKAVAPLIYVWEYDRNFDDYLSPYPCLLVMQQRLLYYRSIGVKGIFVNGSGYDYSSFDDVQTYVLSRLLLNPDADVEQLVRRFYAKFYPHCGSIIADYYMTLEHRVRDTNHILPYYGTLDEEVEAYLNPEEFSEFWRTLDRASKKASGAERTRVSHLLTALAYTRLMLNPSPEERADLLIILRDYRAVPGLLRYKETGGSLNEFLETIGGSSREGVK